MSEIALMANTAATIFIVGLIWFVQRVHYPLLSHVDVDQQISVGAEHQRRTGQVVGLPMAVEGVSTLVLLVNRPDQVAWELPWIGAILLAVSLGSTVFLSVPLHQKMVSHPNAEIGKKLVATNWPRTISWSLRGVICIAMCAQVMK
ncbi:MAG: hypothetical protein WCK23_08395 [Actinomycetes bacterium]